jgi:hypothetical protein
MLDVHLPHGKLRSFSDFLIHLFTITVGLLIAVEIESCVEWRHHVHLAAEARVELRAEIEHNLSDLKQAQPGLKAWQAQIDADLAAIQRIQEHPNDPAAQHANLKVSASGMSLRDTAWKTAQATGALAFMPYEEAERYSSVYQAQSALLAMEDKPMADVGVITGLIAKNHWTEHSKITSEQTSALAERLGQMRWHLAIGDGLMQESIEQDQAFLQNRKAKEDFEENLQR